MSKGPKREAYQVGEDTKAMAKIFVAENQKWRSVWQPVFEERIQEAATRNIGGTVRTKAAQANIESISPDIGLVNSVNTAGDIAIGAVKNLVEANARTLQATNKAQVDALATSLGFSATAGSGLAAASRFETRDIMGQNKADMLVNKARSGITKSLAKQAGGAAGGFALDAIAGPPEDPIIDYGKGSKYFQMSPATSSILSRIS